MVAHFNEQQDRAVLLEDDIANQLSLNQIKQHIQKLNQLSAD
ncbi:MAG: hypothetical protein AAGA46_08280 [Cyanobacteria bacterium P01_F01_bin.13]